VYDDPNDGKLGFGLMTNEPEYPFQLRNVQHYMWKQQMARPAVTMPGTWCGGGHFRAGARRSRLKARGAAGTPTSASYGCIS
jgi:hypothetical protein